MEPLVDESDTFVSSYVTGYPRVVFLTSLKSFVRNVAPTNHLVHYTTFVPSSFHSVVSPNVDTLYSTAWLDLHHTHTFHLPDMRQRYFVMTVLDEWTNVIGSVGSRTGQRAQTVQIALGTRPVTDVSDSLACQHTNTLIQSPTQYVWVILRFYCRDAQDVKTVNELQFQVFLNRKPGMTIDSHHHSPPVPDQVAKMKPREFFSICQLSFPKLSSDMQAKSVRDAQTAIAEYTGSVAKHGWDTDLSIGRFGNDILLRAYTAMSFLGANILEDTIYWIGKDDHLNEPLHGSHRYMLQFVPPPVHAFWSLTVYNAQNFFFPLPVHAIRSASAVATQDSYDQPPRITVCVQKSKPRKGATGTENWLPVLAEPFHLVFRLYWPQERAVMFKWVPPLVYKLS